MRCVVINLPVAGERREAIGREFGKVGLDYEIWRAVDGSRLTEEELGSADNETRHRLGYDEMDHPALACLLSHTAALRSLADSEDEMIAVFEDDAILHPDVAGVLAALEEEPEGFDVVKLQRSADCRRAYFPVRPLGPGHTLGRLRFHDFGCYGYVITRGAARRILERFPRPVFEIDWIVPRFWENGLERIYYLDPPVVFHNDALPSYIEPQRAAAGAAVRARRRRHPGFACRKLYGHFLGEVRKRRGFRKLRTMDRGGAAQSMREEIHSPLEGAVEKAPGNNFELRARF